MAAEMALVVPFPTGSAACFRATCWGTTNPIPPHLPRASIPAFGLLGPPGGSLDPPISGAVDSLDSSAVSSDSFSGGS